MICQALQGLTRREGHRGQHSLERSGQLSHALQVSNDAISDLTVAETVDPTESQSHSIHGRIVVPRALEAFRALGWRFQGRGTYVPSAGFLCVRLLLSCHDHYREAALLPILRTMLKRTEPTIESALTSHQLPTGSSQKLPIHVTLTC